ncbi:hypothetical protein DY000_02003398 [Brassica cretica]|uniref:SDE2/SF3A3 SAP domain-containing protein n=1 Tax=Brassica cretica TaxID=69181 RepID=A0ABQ7C8Y9_BRACR|nr:hypothetical protein DY000_02003398 [Brassica cretica]
MSGRRLRHVNAEKRLEEWKEGEEERKLERLADEFLKKQASRVKEGVGNGATQKKGKRAVDASDSDDSSDEEEDEKEKNNGSQVESSGLGMAHDGDSSGGENSSVDAEKNLVEVTCGTLVMSVDVKSQGNDSEVKPEGVAGETESVDDTVCCLPVGPLNFDDFNSAKDLEVLGMERLKTELQSHGLKCGGTLQERTARLFLLKSTPLDKLPKKLLAKK